VLLLSSLSGVLLDGSLVVALAADELTIAHLIVVAPLTGIASSSGLSRLRRHFGPVSPG
jgi:hypothetical protein